MAIMFKMHSMVDFIEQIEFPTTIINMGAHHGAYAIVLGKDSPKERAAWKNHCD